MNKTEFLDDDDVKAFVNWLAKELPNMTFQLNFPRSRFVPGGCVAKVNGIEAVLNQYVWNTIWEYEGAVIQSSDWIQTKQSLAVLKSHLQNALQSEDNETLLAACNAVLQWGGVSGAKPFLRRKAAEGKLVTYLTDMKELLSLDGSQQLEDLSAVERFDAGLTKSHALIDDTGSPIYDSRVGAAIAMLYQLYGAASPKFKNKLKFPSGAARGKQIRNPAGLGYAHAPQFYTQVTDEFWAQSQVKLGWLLQAVLEVQKNWFKAGNESLAERCHAFEATLFMIGYDLQCMVQDGSVPPRKPAKSKSTGKKDATDRVPNWVPTVSPFSALMPHYVAHRRSLSQKGHKFGTGLNHFRNYLKLHYTPEDPPSDITLDNYLYPFKQTEFDFENRSFEEIDRLHRAALGKKDETISKFLQDFELEGDERKFVCLVDVWIVGACAKHKLRGKSFYQVCVKAGFAGNEGGAKNLGTVGRNVGRYFNLLGKDGMPTMLFHEVFDNQMEDLEEQLNNTIANVGI